MKVRWGRRLGSTIGAVILITVAFYITLFNGIEFDWWNAYSKYMLAALGFLVGALSLTDVIKNDKT